MDNYYIGTYGNLVNYVATGYVGTHTNYLRNPLHIATCEYCKTKTYIEIKPNKTLRCESCGAPYAS